MNTLGIFRIFKRAANGFHRIIIIHWFALKRAHFQIIDIPTHCSFIRFKINLVLVFDNLTSPIFHSCFLFFAILSKLGENFSTPNEPALTRHLSVFEYALSSQIFLYERIL